MGSRIVVVAGGTGSGKTTLSTDLRRIGGEDAVQVLSLDSYYRSHAGLTVEARTAVNYDHPNAIQVELLVEHLALLQKGESVDIPIYNFASHTRETETERRSARDVIIVEGILTLYFSEIRDLMSYSVFVDTPGEVRLQRRLRRDVRERGRTEESVVAQWNDTVEPMYEKFCEPTKQFASEIFNGASWTDGDVSALWERALKTPPSRGA